MSDRKAKFDEFILAANAAAANCRVEYHAHGESAALITFVEFLETAAAGLHHLLGEVRLTSGDEAKAAKVFALKQKIEVASKETVTRSKELTELLTKRK